MNIYKNILLKTTCLLLSLTSITIYAKDIKSIQEGMTNAVISSMQEKQEKTYKIKKRDFTKQIKDVKTLKWYTDLAVIDALKDESIYYNESVKISAEAQRNGDVKLTFSPVSNNLTDKDYRKLKKDIKNVIQKEKVNKLSSDLEKVKWVYNYVINHCSYAEYDANEKQLNNPYNAFYDKQTQCYGYTLLVKEFLDQLNIENKVMAGKYVKKGFEDYYIEAAGRYAYEMHAWNLVKVDNKWYHLDATFGDNRKLGDKNQFLLFGNDAAKETRSWSTIDVPEDINADNYYSNEDSNDQKNKMYEDLYYKLR